jgi:hypothetical protein
MICFFILQVYVLGEGIMISFITFVVSVYNDLFCVNIFVFLCDMHVIVD